MPLDGDTPCAKWLKPDLSIGAGVRIIIIERPSIFKPDSHEQQHDFLKQRQLTRPRLVALVEPIKTRLDGVGERMACFVDQRAPQRR